jgi:hypothetical protein
MGLFGLFAPKNGAEAFLADMRNTRRYGKGDPVAEAIVSKMETCPNNPKNGGQGYEGMARGDQDDLPSSWWV